MGRVPIAAAVLWLATLPALAQSDAGASGSACPFNAAFYSVGPGHGKSPTLWVFPCVGKAVSVPLPFALGAIAYSPDGRAVYATAYDLLGPARPGVFRIEISPVRVTEVPGSSSFHLGVKGLAVSKDLHSILVTGRRLSGNPRDGIFELGGATGEPRVVVAGDFGEFPDWESVWTNLSLSPDGSHSLASRDHRLELIELRQGTTASLGHGFVRGYWSPDGEWVAAVRANGGARERIALLGARTLTVRRDLGSTDGAPLVWSPDSRFLLVWKRERCGVFSGSYGALEKIDVADGKRSKIAGSGCAVNQFSYGWVNDGIVKLTTLRR
jgi:hypothetical protein